MPEPSVSPADTIRRNRATIISGLNWYAGNGKACATNATAALEWLDALLAVGERDKAEIAALKGCPAGEGCAINSGAVHCFHCRRNWPRDETWEQPFLDRPDLRHQKIETMHGLLDTVEAERERDRRRIAQLTELAEELAATPCRYVPASMCIGCLYCRARAVLAGERDGVCECGHERESHPQRIDGNGVESRKCWCGCLQFRAVFAGEEDAP